MLRRAASAAFFTLGWTAVSLVLPQLYLAERPDRALLLNVFLLASAGAGFLGIRLSRALLARGLGLTTGRLVLALLGCVACLAPVFHQAPLLAYLAALVAFRALSNALYNHLDATLVRAAGAGRVATHTQGWVVALLAGSALGPFLAGGLVARPWALLAIFGVVSVGVAALVWEVRDVPLERVPVAATRMPVRSCGFLGACLLMQAGAWSLVGQMVYLVEAAVPPAWLAVAAAAFLGGGNLLSAGSVVLLGSLSRGTPRRWMLVLSSGLAAVAVPPFLVPGAGVGLLAMGAGLAAISASGFLLLSRRLAVAWDADRPGAPVLSRFNNVGNLGPVVGFAGSAALAAVVPGSLFQPALLIGVLLLFVLAGGMFALSPEPDVPPSRP